MSTTPFAYKQYVDVSLRFEDGEVLDCIVFPIYNFKVPAEPFVQMYNTLFDEIRKQAEDEPADYAYYKTKVETAFNIHLSKVNSAGQMVMENVDSLLRDERQVVRTVQPTTDGMMSFITAYIPPVSGLRH